jgi:hypothetical protein
MGVPLPLNLFSSLSIFFFVHGWYYVYMGVRQGGKVDKSTFGSQWHTLLVFHLQGQRTAWLGHIPLPFLYYAG